MMENWERATSKSTRTQKVCNNTMLKLMVYLVECGYFIDIWFIFLIVGHTKNAADRPFNLLKKDYQAKNIYTMAELMGQLDQSDFITVVESNATDFLDQDTFLGKFYSSFTGRVKKNHIFHVCRNMMQKGNQIEVELWRSDLPEDKITIKRSSTEASPPARTIPWMQTV